MNYTFIGKNIQVTEALKEKTIEKIDRISRLFPENTDVTVTFGVTKLAHTVEVTIPLHKRILRAEITADDTYVALDQVVDILERQMVKFKNRLRDKSRRDSSFKEEYNLYSKDNSNNEDSENGKIVKSKKFAVKPMDSDEAVIEMDLLGHDFHVFRNATTDEVNVVYRRKDGAYGLIEPEY